MPKLRNRYTANPIYTPSAHFLTIQIVYSQDWVVLAGDNPDPKGESLVII
jgi:hypothetical protein